MLNRVILIGRLTADIELRHSNDQVPYCYFTLAVNRPRNKDKADFIPCVAFRQTAELMKRYLGKGSLISLEGRMEVYSTQKNGEYNTRINVVTDTINFLDSKNSRNNSTSNDIQANINENLSFSNESKKLENNQPTSNTKEDSEEEFDFDNFEIKI